MHMSCERHVYVYQKNGKITINKGRGNGINLLSTMGVSGKSREGLIRQFLTRLGGVWKIPDRIASEWKFKRQFARIILALVLQTTEKNFLSN